MFGSVLCWCLSLIHLVFKNKRYDCYSVCNSRAVFNTAELVVLRCLKLYKGANGLFYPSSTAGTIRSPTLSNGSRVLVVFETDSVKKNRLV